MINWLSDHLKALAIGLACLIVLSGGGLFVFGKLNRYQDDMVVRSLDWRRTIPVEVFRTLHQDTLRYQMPFDAFNVYRYESCRPQFDTEGHYTGEDCDDRARYDINRWTWDRDLVTTGDVKDERIWPDFKGNPVEALGNQREGARREQFFVHFTRSGKSEFTLETAAVDVWTTYFAGQRYRIEVNRMEEPIWDTIQLVNAQ